MSDAKGKIPLHTKILIGLVLGALLGALAQWQFGSDHPTLKLVVKDYLQPIGNIFLNIILMIVVSMPWLCRWQIRQDSL